MIGTAPAIPSPLAQSITEDRRLASRAAVRQQDAKFEIIRQRIELQNRQLADLDGRADALVAEHERVATPAQERLAEVEGELARCISERLPSPPDLESERVSLLNEIVAANEKLERDLTPTRTTRQKLQREISDLRVEVGAGAALLNQLTQLPLANRDLWLQKFAAQQAEVWLGRRVQAAGGQLATALDLVAKVEKFGEGTASLSWSGRAIPRGVDHEELALAKLRVERWAAETETARAEHFAAMNTVSELHQKMIDE